MKANRKNDSERLCKVRFLQRQNLVITAKPGIDIHIT